MILVVGLLISFSYFLSMHSSFDYAFYAVLPALLYISLFRLKYYKLLTICSISFIGYILFHYELLLNGFRILLNEGIYALSSYGWLLPQQVVSGADATLAISLMLYLLAFVISEKNSKWLLVVAILLPFFLRVPIHLLSFSMLFIMCIITIQYSKHQTISTFQVAIVVILCCISIPIQSIPSLNQFGQQFTTIKNTVQYDASKETQFSHGHFQMDNEFVKSNRPAFKIAMEEPRAMYLKQFVGVHFDNNWSIQPKRSMASDYTIVKHLEKANHFESTQFAQATKEQSTQLLSIQHVNFNKQFALVPYELTSFVEDFEANGAMWKSTKWLGTERYSYKVDSEPITNYPEVASKLYEDEEFQQLAALTQYLSTQYDTELTQPVQLLLKNHFKKTDFQTFEEVIKEVKKQLEMLTYEEHPKQPTGNPLAFLLEESKAGYSVHYATLATLLFRYFDVPARYVEGYIITNQDIQHAKKYSEFTITNNSRHAWPEIYITSIGWVPVEVTPGYAELMPKIAETTFTQQVQPKSEVAPNNSSDIAQVQEQTLPEEPAKEIQSASKWPLLWLLLLLPLFIALWYWSKRRRLNQIKRHFMKLIRNIQKKSGNQASVHELIYSLNSSEALEAYTLYNEIMYYQNGSYSQVQLKKMKDLVKVIRKQLND